MKRGAALTFKRRYDTIVLLTEGVFNSATAVSEGVILMKRISVIVPCYNEAEVLEIFYNEISKVSAQMSEYDFQFIFVDDGSKDRTLEIMKGIASRDKRAVFVALSRNFGKESAMLAGLSNADGDYIAIMDADMQDPPDLLPQMARTLEEEDCDCVATRRVDRAGEPLIESFFARLFYKIINKISDADIADGARDYRLMKREMADAILSMNEYNRFSKGIFGWVGFKTKWLPFENRERAAGETKWNFWKLLKYSIDGIINFSQVPLSISSWCGLGFTLIAFVMLLFVFIRRLAFGDAVSGWASLVCIILFIGGIQLFCMGIIGQYLSKNYMESKKRPHYIIRETNKENNIKKIG